MKPNNDIRVIKNSINDNFVQNKNMKFKLFEMEKCFKGFYTKDKLIELLKSIPFGRISIPIYTYKNIIMKDNFKKGYMSVGFINSFDAATEEFDLTIFGNYVEVVESFEDVIIFPRTMVKDSELMIIGLNICPMKLYVK